ncbi:MAG: PAS domain-containing protein [Deltaproteobacteria bacterium]|nr:PAS domain-containing protein [Deltaproteobacteria bacterium]
MASASVWDAVSDWMMRVTAEGILLGSNNPRGTPFPHVTAANLGKPASRLFPTRAAEVLEELIPRTLETQKASTFEYGFGKHHYAEVRLFPVGHRELVVIARDLTGRKSTEATLRRGRERYALAVQGANDGLWDWQLESDTVYYSLQWKSLVGLDHQDKIPATPQTWLSRIHPEDLEQVRTDLKRHLDGDTPRFENEHRLRCGSGEWIWVLVRGMAVRNARGEPTRIAGSLTDLTHRRVVAAAEDKSRLLEYATRAVGIGIAILMPDGRLTQVSPTLGEMVSDWPDPSTWWDAVKKVTQLPRGMRCPICRRRQHVGAMLAEVSTPEDEPRMFEITITGHAHEVHRTGSAHVVLVEDVTEQKLAERKLKILNAELIVARDRALASSRAKSTFLANMSHELRTPLNVIIGYSEMLLEELEDADSDVGVEELNRINDAGSQLLGLIAGVLELSKIEAGMMEMDVRTFEVSAFVEEMASLVEANVNSANNIFHRECGEDLGEMTTDQGKIRQVLLNLLGNANKFTDGGTVRLEVAMEGPDQLRFVVADTGIGIREELRARLFEEFFQGDLSATKRYQGAGLGLALTSRFVEMMGGTIDVESEVGVGSTFTVRLPRVLSGHLAPSVA